MCAGRRRLLSRRGNQLVAKARSGGRGISNDSTTLMMRIPAMTASDSIGEISIRLESSIFNPTKMRMIETP